MEFRTISDGGQPFVVSQEGEGPDIVLVHGFPGHAALASPTCRAELVKAGWRVTVPWLRGYHPDTIVPGRPYDFETIGRDGLALLDAIGAQRAVFVGHDWGALMTYVMATLAPERMRGIVTIAIPHPSLLERTPASLCRRATLHRAEAAVGRAQRAGAATSPTSTSSTRRWAPNWSGPAREQTLRAGQAGAVLRRRR